MMNRWAETLLFHHEGFLGDKYKYSCGVQLHKLTQLRDKHWENTWRGMIRYTQILNKIYIKFIVL